MEVNMRITYDPRYDLLYLKLGEAAKVLCKDIDEDITLDLDAEGRVVGIEILSASQHLDLKALLPVEIREEALG
jgi:uncharacterized protein YuzE